MSQEAERPTRTVSLSIASLMRRKTCIAAPRDIALFIRGQPAMEWPALASRSVADGQDGGPERRFRRPRRPWSFSVFDVSFAVEYKPPIPSV
jgi:hypothetical protein